MNILSEFSALLYFRFNEELKSNQKFFPSFIQRQCERVENYQPIHSQSSEFANDDDKLTLSIALMNH